MPIHFRCQACERMLSIATRKAGQQVNCPKCGKLVSVPAAAGVAIASDPHSGKPLEAMPLFERKDFEDLLNPAFKANMPEPSKQASLPVAVQPGVLPAAMSHDDSGEAELVPIDGVVITRNRMMLLVLALALLLVLSFLVGYFLARTTSGKSETTIASVSRHGFCG